MYAGAFQNREDKQVWPKMPVHRAYRLIQTNLSMVKTLSSVLPHQPGTALSNITALLWAPFQTFDMQSTVTGSNIHVLKSRICLSVFERWLLKALKDGPRELGKKLYHQGARIISPGTALGVVEGSLDSSWTRQLLLIPMKGDGTGRHP